MEAKMILESKKHVEPVISRVIHIYEKIEAVKDSVHFMADHLRYEYYDYINALSCKKIQMEDSLEALKRATAGTYDGALKNVEDSIDDLNTLLNKIKRRFSS